MDRSPWIAALGGVLGAASAMALSAWALNVYAERFEPPSNPVETVEAMIVGALALGYTLFFSGILGTMIGPTVALLVARQDRIVSTLAITAALEMIAIPAGVAITLYSQDHVLGRGLFIASVVLIVAVVPYTGRWLMVRRL